MKTIKKVLHSRSLVAVIAVLFLAGVSYFTVTSFVRPAQADTSPIPVTGWAWGGFELGSTPGAASGIGWIHFNGTAIDGSKYGIEEDPNTGLLSGFAWSSNYGWVSFNSADLKGCQSSLAPCEAKVSTTTGQVTGWARVCSALFNSGNPKNITNDKRGNGSSCQPLGNGTLDQGTNGWDGFIQLSGTTTQGTPYGVTVNSSNEWSGYAWGANAVGWISFSGTTDDGTPYKVCTNDCKPYNQPITFSCTATPSDGSPVKVGDTVTWSVSGVTGGDGGPYTYSWSDPNSSSDPINSSANKNKASDAVIYNTAGTNYEGQVTVSDSSGSVSYCNAKVSVQSSSNSVCTDQGGCTGGGTSKKTPPTPPACTAPYPAECIKVEPTVTATANPTTADAGSTTTLSWSSTGASYCVISNSPTHEGTNSSKSEPIPTTGSTVTYGVTCYSSSGIPSQPSNVTININYPQLTVSATPDRVGKNGGNVVISWSGTGLKDNSCNVYDPSGDKILSNQAATGSTTPIMINTQSKYTVTCDTAGGGSISQTTIVNVSPNFINF